MTISLGEIAPDGGLPVVVMDTAARRQTFHDPRLWEGLTPNQAKVARMMEETDPATGLPITVVAVARRLGTSRKNVYKVLNQIGAKAAKLA